MRRSTVQTSHDSAGDYEIEIFDCPNPKRAIVCSHGRGVRRWDGKKFFYAVAEHYSDSVVLLVDQNQHAEGVVRMNSLPIAVRRVQELVGQAAHLHPGVPIMVMGHSMGCGVASQLDVQDVSTMVLVTPAAGSPFEGYIERYGADVVSDKEVTSSEGTQQIFPAEFMVSLKGIVWEEEYEKLVEHFSPVYVFEAGDDEIIGEARFTQREIPFTKYEIIEGAKHNLTGKPLNDFFIMLDSLI